MLLYLILSHLENLYFYGHAINILTCGTFTDTELVSPNFWIRPINKDKNKNMDKQAGPTTSAADQGPVAQAAWTKRSAPTLRKRKAQAAAAHSSNRLKGIKTNNSS